jgi:hypothetical protein
MSGVPNVFGSATSSIPLSQLDVNFNTPVTIGNATVGLGNTTTTVGNLTVQNVTLSSTNGDANINGLTVGRGAGAVATNTAVGYQAGNANTTGTNTTSIGYQANNSGNQFQSVAIGSQALYTGGGAQDVAVGYQAGYSATSSSGDAVYVGWKAGYSNTSGVFNVAIGQQSLYSNTLASNNTAVGYQAGYTNTVGLGSTFIGYRAGYASNNTTSSSNYVDNTCIGALSGYNLTTGTLNTFVGGSFGNGGAGYAVTTGSKNTIVGNYSGNQGGLDIRTLSNYIVLSDGDGNPRGYFDGSGNFGIQNTAAAAGILDVETAVGAEGVVYCIMRNNNGTKVNSLVVNSVSTSSYNTAVAALWVGRAAANARSINAGGTVNASGNDYAEYMTKAGDFTIAKGDVVGINAYGKLTNVFADAVSFVVKSTDPSYVGGDTWGSEKSLGLTKPEDDATQEEKDAFNVALEAARQLVDRISFSGQVPVNVTGATAGQYIIPVNDNGAIIGVAVNEADMTLAQYMKAVGKVIAIEQDGRAKIIVKVA